MKFLKKLTGVAVATTILLTSVTAFAENSVEQDAVSDWVALEAYEALSFGIGELEYYNQYKQPITLERFNALHQSLNEKFEASDEINVQNENSITRGEVIDELYDIAAIVLDIDAENPAIDFFVENQIISGRSVGNYALESVCTNEEAIVFAKRMYNLLAYKMGMDSKGFLWKVSDGDNNVYLLGSIHASDYNLYPLSKEILDAFNSSEHLAVELNLLLQSESDVELYNKYGMYQDSRTLKEAIDEDTYNQVSEIFEAFGLPEEYYNAFKPWYAELLISSLTIGTSYDFSLGIDYYCLLFAQLAEKNIIELESAALQLEIFDSFSDELQLKSLKETLGSIDEFDESIDAMLEAWKLGSVDDLEALLGYEEAEDELSIEYYEKLNVNRNKAMIEKINTMLTDNNTEDFFVVVGALHMLFDEGLVSGMEDLGYTVERIK